MYTLEWGIVRVRSTATKGWALLANMGGDRDEQLCFVPRSGTSPRQLQSGVRMQMARIGHCNPGLQKCCGVLWSARITARSSQVVGIPHCNEMSLLQNTRASRRRNHSSMITHCHGEPVEEGCGALERQAGLRATRHGLSTRAVHYHGVRVLIFARTPEYIRARILHTWPVIFECRCKSLGPFPQRRLREVR